MAVHKGLSFFRNVTSNTVKGENGCIVDERELYPLTFVELYLMHQLYKWTDQRTEIEVIAGEGSDLTPFVNNMFIHETSLSHCNTGYTIRGNGRSYRYQMWDS